MIEVERKRRLPDGPGEILARLGELGYQGSAPVTETDTYFSRPDVDYLVTVECLRVRQRDGFAEITYKPPSDAATHDSGDVIAKREINVRLAGGAGAGDAIGLLAAVGMVELVTVRKSRTVYRHPGRGDALVAVDEIAGLGWFAETEVTGPDPEEARNALEAAEKLLGAEAYPVVSRPYRDLLLDSA